jgi:hypothetical protein
MVCVPDIIENFTSDTKNVGMVGAKTLGLRARLIYARFSHSE